MIGDSAAAPPAKQAIPQSVVAPDARQALASRTYNLERLRAIPGGILETAGGTFLLLIAVKMYEAGAIEKALIAAGGNIGLLVTPFVVLMVERFRWRAAHGASGLAVIGAIAFGVAALFPMLGVYVLGAVLGVACLNAITPLMTQIFQDNYAPSQRGRFFSRATVIRVAAAAVFAELAGRLLTVNPEAFRWLLAVFAVAFGVSALLLRRIPSQPLTVLESSNPFRGLRYLRDDKVFRTTMMVWMLMGFANLMMMPLRIEYLANPAYGMALTAQEIALLTVVIPGIVRLVLSPAWGWLFDRMNFFMLRITINLAFAAGIAVFFTGDSWAGLILGAVVFGVALSGGDLAWSLWVTKFAPPHLVADYMSVHTFFTGVRGVLAPLLAFQLIAILSIETMGVICTGIIVVASLLLVPELLRYRTHLEQL
jgi:MFS family permease